MLCGKVKTKESSVFKFLGLNVYKRETGPNRKRIYILRIPVVSRKIADGGINGRFFFRYRSVLSEEQKKKIELAKKQAKAKAVKKAVPAKEAALAKKTPPFRFLAEGSIEERTPIQSYCDMLGQYDVISFDIFDTALLRKVAIPNHVFDIVSMEMHWPNFTDARKKAEELARQQNLVHLGHREVTLDEIYQFLKSDYGIDDVWKDRECELEMQLSLPNPYIKSIYDRLISDRKEIIFCSDM